MRQDPCPPADIRLVMVDAMFTVLESRETNRQGMIADIYRKDGRLSRVRPREITRAIARARQQFSRELLDEDYWFHVNIAVIRGLDRERKVENQAAAAERIHNKMLSDASLYKVSVTLLGVIRRLRAKGIRVVIASNQREETLRKLLEEFELTNEFDSVYTSERLGVRKPNAGFWRAVLTEEAVGAGQAIHIGNSARSDTGAAAVGICTAICDARAELETCRRHPDRPIAGLTREETQTVRRNLASGRIIPVTSMTALRRCMEAQAII